MISSFQFASVRELLTFCWFLYSIIFWVSCCCILLPLTSRSLFFLYLFLVFFSRIARPFFFGSFSPQSKFVVVAVVCLAFCTLRSVRNFYFGFNASYPSIYTTIYNIRLYVLPYRNRFYLSAHTNNHIRMANVIWHRPINKLIKYKKRCTSLKNAELIISA